MLKNPIPRLLATGMFALSAAVLGITSTALSSKVEAQTCSKCNEVSINCDGSLCDCKSINGKYKCFSRG